MILLLELHRYGLSRVPLNEDLDDQKEFILITKKSLSFHPCGDGEGKSFSEQKLLR